MAARDLEPLKLEPVTLEGRHVRLVPLAEAHAAALWTASSEAGDVWRYMPARVESEADMVELIRSVRARMAGGRALPLCIQLGDGTPIGGTGYWNAEPEHRRVEIGMSWLARPHRRTPANTETKYLMLRHAFERLRCVRVEFKTDARNTASRAALRRIGATEEGTLRHHMLLTGGERRDSVYFSVIAEEWSRVRATLEQLLGR